MNTMQSNNSDNIHVKVNLKNEFRRFSLSELKFSSLEQTLKTLFSLDPALLLAVEYQDEEQDWVTLSSDEELKLATSFCGSPLRLRIRIVGKQSTVPSSFQTESLPAQRMSVEESNTVAAPPKEIRRKQQALTKQERMTAKSERLSERINIIETRLEDPNLKSDRERVLLWKVEKLRETLKETQEAIANFPAQPEEETNSASEDSEPEITFPSDFPRRGRRCGPGRGDRPNARFAVRRGPWNKFAAEQDESVDQEPERKRSFDTKLQETPQDNPNDFRFALSEVKRCRADLKAARASREEEAIKFCEMALQEAVDRKRELACARRAERPKRPERPERAESKFRQPQRK